MRFFALLAAGLMALAAHAQTRYVKYFNSVADLVAANPNDVSVVAMVKYAATPGAADTGAIFYYDAASAAATNTTTIFKPLSFGGRWIRGNAATTGGGGDVLFTDFQARQFQTNALAPRVQIHTNRLLLDGINVKDPPHNAVGDGVADDTVAIQAAIDAGATAKAPVYFPENSTFLVTTSLVLKSNSKIVGGGTVRRGFSSSKPEGIFKTQGATFPGWGDALAINVTNILIDGIRLEANYDGGSYTGPGLVIDGARNVQIRNISVLSTNTSDWAVFLRGENISFSGGHVENGGWPSGDGVHVYGGSGISVTDSVINSGDDAIAIGGERNQSIENVVVGNIVANSRAARAVAIFQNTLTVVWPGTAPDKKIRNIVVNGVVGYSGQTNGSPVVIEEYNATNNTLVGEAPYLIQDVSLSNLRLNMGVKPTAENYTHAIRITGSSNTFISDLVLSNANLTGLFAEQTEGLTLRDLQMGPTATNLFPLLRFSSTTNRNLRIVGGRFVGHADRDVAAFGPAQNVLVHGAHFTVASGRTALGFSGTHTNITITGNIFEGAGTAIALVDSGDRYTVLGNNFANTGVKVTRSSTGRTYHIDDGETVLLGRPQAAVQKWLRTDTSATAEINFLGGRPIFNLGGTFHLLGTDSLTDASSKKVMIGLPHYTNSEEPLAGMFLQSDATQTLVDIGGGTSSANAATRVSIHTAADNTTTTGTERFRVGPSGVNVNYGSLQVTNALTAQSVTVSNVAASTILRTDANKALAAVTIGANLTFDGTTLSATGGGGGGGPILTGVQYASAFGGNDDGSFGENPTATNWGAVKFNSGANDLQVTLPDAGTYMVVSYFNVNAPSSFDDYFKLTNHTAGADISTQVITPGTSSAGRNQSVTLIGFVTTGSGNNIIKVLGRSGDATYGSHTVMRDSAWMGYHNLDAGSSVYVNGSSVALPNFTDSSTALFATSATTNVSVYPTNIANAQISGSAAIAKSKISTTGEWPATDIPTTLRDTTFTNITLNGTMSGAGSVAEGLIPATILRGAAIDTKSEFDTHITDGSVVWTDGDQDKSGTLNLTGRLTVSGALRMPAHNIDGGTSIDFASTNTTYAQLTANTTYTFANVSSGDRHTHITEQDGTGGRTIGWPAGIVWVNNATQSTTPPTVRTNANTILYWHFEHRSGTNYGWVDGPTAQIMEDISQVTGSTEGDILYRNASAWTRLPRGSNGEILKSTASTIEWGAAAGGGDVSFTDFNTDQFNTNNATYKIAIKSGALMTNLTFNGLTASRLTKLDGSKVLVNAIEGTDFLTAGSTNTLTQKTYDADAAGNVLKITDYVDLMHPHRADGTGAVIRTNDNSAVNWGQAAFSGSGATNANWIEFDWIVPEDIDTSVNMRVKRFKLMTAGTSNSDATFHFGMKSIADSADSNPTTFDQWVIGTLTPSSAAANDVFTLSDLVLTNWAGNVTAGQRFKIRVQRDGAGDANNDALTTQGLRIQYGRSM